MVDYIVGDRQSGRVRGRPVDVALLGVAAVWGSSYLAAKTGTAAAPVVLVLFWRYAVSVVGSAAALRRRPTRAEWRTGVWLGITQAAVLALETFGVAHTSAANAGLLISLSIVITPAFESVRSATRLPPRFAAAAGTCVLGVALLSTGSGFHAPGLGDALVLTAAVVRAAHVVLVGRLTARRKVQAVGVTTVQTIVGTVLFALPAAPLLHRSVHFSAATWGCLLYLALGCSVFAFVAQTWAVQRSSPSRASLLLGTEPVWAAVIGIGVGGERLGVLGLIGAALVVGGVYWGQAIERHSRRRRLTCPPAIPIPS